MLLIISLITLVCSIWSLYLCVTTFIDILTTGKKIREQEKKDREFAEFVRQARIISTALVGPIAEEKIIRR